MQAPQLPPLLSQHQREDRVIVVPPPHSTSVNASSAHGVVRQLLRDGPLRPTAPRSAGGRGSSGGTGERRRVRLSEQRAVLPKEARRDPSAPLPVVTEKELTKGLMSCINRGLIPGTFDVSEALGGGGDMPGGPFSVAAADIRPHQEQFARRELLTADYGFAQVCNVRLDVQAVLNPVQPPRPPAPPAEPVDAAQQLESPDGKHLGDKQRDETRTYAELLDLYSLHEFVIRKGKTLTSTPEFESYQRSYSVLWGAIGSLIRLLEQLLGDFGIPLAYIDGKKLAKLAEIDMGTPSTEQLMACIANRDEVAPLMEVPGRRFQQGEKGFRAAAVKIQSVARMWLQKLRYADLKASNLAAVRIQRHWQIHQNHMHTRTVLASTAQREEQRWRQLMDRFVRDWGTIRQGPRLVVHLSSLSYTAKQCGTIPFFDCFQNSQLARLLDLADPDVEVVYISPFPIEQEALQYYTKILQMNGVQNVEGRLQVMVPENRSRLPSGLSLTKSVLFSQRHIKRLCSLTKGKNAYIVPGVVGKEDLAFAARLGLPMLGPDPATAPHFAGKSGAKRIFDAADVVIPIGAYDLFEESELLVILSKFIAEYQEYGRWLIKVDHEFGGRGLAYVDVRKLKCMEGDHRETEIPALRERVYVELKDYIGKRAKIVTPQLYPDWSAFIADFNTHGGVLEAVPPDVVSSPSANIFISPDGGVELLSVQEQVLSPAYCALGASFPQTAVPHAAIRDAALSIGGVCYQKKIMGHVSIDFVVFRRKGQLRMWAVDLDLHLTNNALAHKLFQFATRARVDAETGACSVAKPDAAGVVRAQPRSYVYSGLVYHPYIGALRHSVFFNHCRHRGLSFDTDERAGTLFHIVDTLLRGCIGVLCIGRGEAEPIGMLSDAMEFIQQQLSSSSCDDADTNFHYAAGAARGLFQRFVAERRALAGGRARRKSGGPSSVVLQS
eukprot:TRINITY_DN16790_c0_g1_i1.p1 TRINITY_DN16790_c0_g1~~TRINITY_DN16790_c0_g1_i1.p1  ORF type:complete len:948 (+),score=284.41 TRINITY_DN16790_c0_g1_i1:65-2908(+)